MAEKLVKRNNYLLVMEYLEYLKDKGRNPKSITRYWFLLKHLLLFAMDVPFPKIYRIKPGLNAYVTGLELSAESRKAITNHSRSFLRWCKNYHAEEFATLPQVWIEDLTPVAVTAGSKVKPVTEDEILRIARLKPHESDLALQRDQAAACLLFLSGIRGGSFVSLPIHAVVLNVDRPHILEYPELGVQTKNKKRAKTYLYHITELLKVVTKWDRFVRINCEETSPWYMPISQHWGMQALDNTHILGANRGVTLNHRLRILWNMLSLPHKSPHKFRHGAALYGLRRCTVMEDYHLLSRNLMHHDLTITDQLYINFEDRERGEAIERISNYPLNSQSFDRHSKHAAPSGAHLQGLLHTTDCSEQSIELLAERIISYLDRRMTVEAPKK
jgi:integrase